MCKSVDVSLDNFNVIPVNYHYTVLILLLTFFAITVSFTAWLDMLCNRLDEAKAWLNGLSDSGGCNLLEAIKHIYRVKDLEAACIVVGSL